LFLKTLSKREIRSGFAEFVKHSLIADKDQWLHQKTIEKLDDVEWKALLLPSLKIKKLVVENDPFEKGWRKALNFGHTIGHGIEGVFLETDQPLLHGEAIAIGMICESYLSYKQVGLSKNELDIISQFLLKIYGKVHLPETLFQEMIQLMKKDKKNENAQINFTMLKSIGTAAINQIANEKLIIESLAYYNRLVRR
ncbi:MAG TPA: 3-dehydroquinate synthase, partial [Saprospiraceae bacterium]|nr:3-dehydroquinate synthase [Saprospiraceae bacterium]